MTGYTWCQSFVIKRFVKTGSKPYDEAESEPWMRLDDFGRVVAAVVAPADEPFVALDLLLEAGLATGEDETHVGGLCCYRSSPGKKKMMWYVQRRQD